MVRSGAYGVQAECPDGASPSRPLGPRWPSSGGWHDWLVPQPRTDRTRSGLDPQVAARLKRDGDGLIVAVVQQHDTREVLMVGYMDDEALHRTLTTGRATYYSRSRQDYWVKGETSGHVQWVRSAWLDCDGDAVLVRVDQQGPACHTGDQSCFDSDNLPVTIVDSVPASGTAG
jgi:phosphoribosyl-AMP cyclohydrolase